MIVRIVSGSYYGRFSGIISVNEVVVVSIFLIVRIGNFVVISVGICG